MVIQWQFQTEYFLLFLLFSQITGTELTFELKDNSIECFEEYIKKDTDVQFEYQVQYL